MGMIHPPIQRLEAEKLIEASRRKAEVTKWKRSVSYQLLQNILPTAEKARFQPDELANERDAKLAQVTNIIENLDKSQSQREMLESIVRAGKIAKNILDLSRTW